MEERINIQTNLKSKAQKAGAITAARLRAKSVQPLKLGLGLKRAAKLEKLEIDPLVIQPKKTTLEPASKAENTILDVDTSSASESAVIET